ncbi:unnamed protein product [Caenorhabditis auriculariae]|uniref:Uncharacterized protein n=1 Tax=Caenorhabditis auriculariae TaxID=2777116 RepID=A0A8S1HZ97_9PELO|nr:unnamed protein product [Caenorhabditis auriculariae]
MKLPGRAFVARKKVKSWMCYREKDDFFVLNRIATATHSGQKLQAKMKLFLIFLMAILVFITDAKPTDHPITRPTLDLTMGPIYKTGTSTQRTNPPLLP